MPAFNSAGDVVTWSGFAPLIQEWVNQPDYDPTTPIGMVLGPGDAVGGEERLFSGQNPDPPYGSESTRFQPVLEITYRPRRIHVVG